MKNAAFLVAMLVLWVIPLPAPAEGVGTIETLQGRVYHDCHIVRVHPDGVSFRHDTGAAKILFTDLPEKWQRKFGYDPAKAEAYEKELAKAREEEQERLERRYAEMAEARQRAHEMAMARIRAAERQASAYAPMALVPGGPVPFIGSALGQTTFAYGPQSAITGPAFGGRQWANGSGCFWYNGGFVSLGGGSGGMLTVGSFSPVPRFNYRGAFYPGFYHTSPTLGTYRPGYYPAACGAGLPFTGLGAVPGIGPSVIVTPPAIGVRIGGVSAVIGR